MSKVKRALKRAAAYSAGGSVGPAPKAHKLVGEFRDPTERAGGIPFLIPWGTNPKNIDRGLGARRQRDPNEPYPDVGRAIVRRADGGSVIDELRHDIELHNANQVTPEQRRENLKTTGMDVLSATPVIGNLLSAKDAGTSGRETYEAARSGNLKRALGQAALTGLNTAGAFLGLPWSKAAGDVAKDAGRTARIFAGPEAKTADKVALQQAEALRAAGADRDAIWRATGWAWDERGLPYFEISDKGAKVRPPTEFVGGQPVEHWTTFDNFLDHPELFKSLPDVGAHKFSGHGQPGSGAYYAGQPGQINVGPGKASDPDLRRRVSLHEGQHAADDARGASSGANSRVPVDADYQIAVQKMREMHGESFTRVEALQQRLDDLMREAWGRSSFVRQTPEMAAVRAELLTATNELREAGRMKGTLADPKLYAYHFNPGEARARNTEARRDMDALERRDAPPWHTLDVDEGDILPGRNSSGAPSEVMIPAPESKANDIARDLRSQGVPNEGISRNADKRFFGPDGSLRTEVDDRGMTLKRDFQPGDRAPMGDVVDHPTLFGQRPELRDMPVNFTDQLTTEANQPGRKFGVARRARDGTAEITAGQPLDFYKQQLAKLMQYDVAKGNNWAAGIRHDFQGVRDDYANALRIALEIAEKPRPGEDVGAALAYIEKMQPLVDKMLSAGPVEGSKLYKDAQKLTTGNIDARIVRQRAVQTDDARKAWGPYPYAQGARGVGPGFRNARVIPFNDAPREDVAKLLSDWQEFGIGRGNFANGGRAKRVGRALKRARVTVGAVSGRTGGRADALAVSVPAGSYVVPADVVAALGEGNTAAGMAKLEKQFPAGKSAAPRRANGGAVPIQISDGEFVIPPEAIAALGRGDANYGHDILDAFVVSTRKAYTDHLSNLPGPNQ